MAKHNGVSDLELGSDPSKTSSQVALTETSFNPSRTKLEKVLIFVGFVLLILSIVFIVLYIQAKNSSSSSTSGVVKNPTKSAKPAKCLRKGCVVASSSILQAMNLSVDPCDDFYLYSCGGWMQKNSIPDTRTSWSQFKILNDRNEALMKQMIQDSSLREKYSSNEAVRKAFDYYDACIDEAKIESLGDQPLQQLIKDYGSWNVTDKNFNASNWDFMETFVKIQKYLSIAPLFNMFVATDLKESTKNIIVFDQSGLSMSRDSYFYNTTFYNRYRESYKTLMVELMKALGAEDAEARAAEVYAFEETLAKIFVPKEQRRDSSKLYNKITLRELDDLVGEGINITDFLERMFAETDYKITQDEEIVIYAISYMKNVSQVFQKTEKRIIANYMMWHVAVTYSSLLSSRFTEIFDKHRQTSFGTQGKDPRWQRCMGSVQDAFGMAVGLLFTDKRFSGESKTSAEDMIRDIREVFISNLAHIDWMDDETKKAAEDKARAIRENIGYPNYITNATALAKEYEGFNVTKSTYFMNNYYKRKFNNMKNYKDIGKPVDKTTWSMIPPMVNAYYSSTDNKIVFPAGILQDPFYDQSHLKSLNYGGIGMVVGHEISHGFDDNGRKFNKDGNLLKWWTNSSIANFEQKTKCLVEQYSNYTFHGINLNGKQTLGENIADNGGIKQAFQAYQMWKTRHEEEPQLPGLDLTNDQLFFLSFAQIWCSSFRQSGAISAIENGVHSPGRFRVIGSLSNSHEFAEAFQCTPGSRMNPVKKCKVW